MGAHRCDMLFLSEVLDPLLFILGCLATTGALVMSAIKMRQGQSKTMNYWLRARVVLQGLTLVVLVAGSMTIQKSRRKKIEEIGADGLPRNEAASELSREQKKEKERQEFADRLEEARQASEMESGAGLTGMKTVTGPTVHKERRKEERKKQAAKAEAEATESTTAAIKKSNSWKWWSKGSSSDESS